MRATGAPLTARERIRRSQQKLAYIERTKAVSAAQFPNRPAQDQQPNQYTQQPTIPVSIAAALPSTPPKHSQQHDDNITRMSPGGGLYAEGFGRVDTEHVVVAATNQDSVSGCGSSHFLVVRTHMLGNIGIRYIECTDY